MENFIWVGDQAINLNWVVRVQVEDDGQRAIIYMKDDPPQEPSVTFEGEDAGCLLAALGREKSTQSQDTGEVNIVVVRASGDLDGRD